MGLRGTSCLGALLGAGLWSLPASPLHAAEPEPTVHLEVEVAPNIVESAELVRWIEDEGRRALDELPEGTAPRGVVHVGISGTLYDYQVTLDATHDGTPLEGSTWPCECSNEDLLAALRPGLVQALQQLREATTSDPATTAPPRRRVVDRFDPLGWTGIAAMSVGGAALVTGVVFLALGDQTPAGFPRAHDYRVPGAFALGAGAGLVLTGATLVWLRGRGELPERRHGLEALAPALDRDGRPWLVVRGRF